MQYVSDKESNKALVKELFFDNEENVIKEDQKEVVESGYAAKRHVLSLSYDLQSRKAIVRDSLDYSFELAVWKAITPAEEWTRFLSELRANGVSIRDITEIKKLVDEGFKLLLNDVEVEEVTTDKLLILDDVKSFSAKRGRNGLTLRIELL